MKHPSTEQETVIRYDETTSEAEIFTENNLVARSLKKAGYSPVKHTEDGWWFRVKINKNKNGTVEVDDATL